MNDRVWITKRKAFNKYGWDNLNDTVIALTPCHGLCGKRDMDDIKLILNDTFPDDKYLTYQGIVFDGKVESMSSIYREIGFMLP